MKEAAARADEILRTHAVEPLPDSVAAEVEAILERYARSAGAPADRVGEEGRAMRCMAVRGR